MIKQFLTLALISTSLLACSTQSHDLFTPPEPLENGSTTKAAKIMVQQPNRDVDILFVIDQSASMASIIKEVHANIDRFVEAFTSDESQKINFRIGVTTAWDSKHFEETLPRQLKNNRRPPKLGIDHWPQLDFDLQQGRLQSVIINGQIASELPPYISQDLIPDKDELVMALRNTLKVNAEIYRYEQNKDGHLRNVYELTQNYADSFFSQNTQPNGKPQPLYGPSPENEEFFSTIYKMTNHLGGSLYSVTNQKFPNPKASQLAIFIITDAEDDVQERTTISINNESAVAMTADRLYKHLVNFMGNDKSKVAIYGALYESGRKTCQVRALDDKGNFIIDPNYKDGFVAANGLEPSALDTPYDQFVFTDKKRDPGKNADYRGPQKIERLIALAELLPMKKERLIEVFKNLNLTVDVSVIELSNEQLVERILAAGYVSKNVKSICADDFGAELANVGFRIKEQVLQQEDVVIDVRAEYDKNSLQVYYGAPNQGGTLIPHSAEKGWSHIVKKNTSSLIRIDKSAYKYQEGKRFFVFYENLTFKNQTKKVR